MPWRPEAHRSSWSRTLTRSAGRFVNRGALARRASSPIGSAALDASTHQPRVSVPLARLASQHGVQRVAGAGFNRRDYVVAGRALVDPGLQCLHSPDPSSVRPANRLIEFHRGCFTSVPRLGKRHEKPFCGVGHTRSATTSSSHVRFPLGTASTTSEPAEALPSASRQPGHMRRSVVDENDAAAKEVFIHPKQ